MDNKHLRKLLILKDKSIKSQRVLLKCEFQNYFDMNIFLLILCLHLHWLMRIYSNLTCHIFVLCYCYHYGCVSISFLTSYVVNHLWALVRAVRTLAHYTMGHQWLYFQRHGNVLIVQNHYWYSWTTAELNWYLVFLINVYFKIWKKTCYGSKLAPNFKTGQSMKKLKCSENVLHGTSKSYVPFSGGRLDRAEKVRYMT